MSGLKKGYSSCLLFDKSRVFLIWNLVSDVSSLVVYILGNKIFAQTASIRFDLEYRAMGKWLKRSVHKIGYVKESRYTCMFLMGCQI